ncbi:MAG: hypothetical protein BGO89_06160 [Candidatus Kapaibacterium thiocyanatum]|uniref:Uncharacterized protein n=1 Tax=Candidatus Kapaibacterium thiocyanatum TaxID=1895771 RepID=A0A1M3KZW1_9BACT|nr:MAG: hypothetical protein BGO89_06160 ['Candidatus Kapabacteria' thiocyanatum]
MPTILPMRALQMQAHADVGLPHTPCTTHDRIHRRQEIQADNSVLNNCSTHQRITDDTLLDKDVLHLFRGFLLALGMKAQPCGE